MKDHSHFPATKKSFRKTPQSCPAEIHKEKDQILCYVNPATRAEILHSNLNSKTKITLIAISMSFNEYGYGNFSSIDLLSDLTSLPIKTIRKCIKIAIKDNWLKRNDLPAEYIFEGEI